MERKTQWISELLRAQSLHIAPFDGFAQGATLGCSMSKHYIVHTFAGLQLERKTQWTSELFRAQSLHIAPFAGFAQGATLKCSMSEHYIVRTFAGLQLERKTQWISKSTQLLFLLDLLKVQH